VTKSKNARVSKDASRTLQAQKARRKVISATLEEMREPASRSGTIRSDRGKKEP
jgi:hypothetical protein